VAIPAKTVARAPVSITHPTASQTLPSPVTVAGTCSKAGDTITVGIHHTSDLTASDTVTPTGTLWATKGFSLISGQQYVAIATAKSAPSAPDTKVFNVS
jgi:hypothetical protein